LDYDHTAVLGDTLGQIAFEKAGIMKQGVPAIYSPQELEAEEALPVANITILH